MPRLSTLRPRVATLDTRRAAPAPTAGHDIYRTREWQQARQAALLAAMLRCCKCDRTGVRLFVDHIVEIADGGAAYDPANLQVLCGACHTAKTHVERVRRAGG